MKYENNHFLLILRDRPFEGISKNQYQWAYFTGNPRFYEHSLWNDLLAKI